MLVHTFHKLTQGLQIAMARWIEAYRVPLTGLALVRVFYAATALLLAVPNFTWISQSPPALFDPPFLSLATLWGGFPGFWFLQFLSSLVCILYIALLFGYRTRIVSLCLSAALILGFSFAYSFGKISHNILVVIFPAVMAFSGWGRALSVDAFTCGSDARTADADGSTEYDGVAWPVALMALLIGFGYFSAGVAKLAWLDFDPSTHGARSWLIRGFFAEGRQELAASLFVTIDFAYFWEGVDILALSFEIGFLFAVIRARFFRAFVVVAVVFHIANYLMLNISFSFASMVRVYVLFMPWMAVFNLAGADTWRRVACWQPTVRWMLASIAGYMPLYWFSQAVIGRVAPMQLRHVAPLEAACTLVPGLDYGMLASFVLFGVGVMGVVAALYAVLQRQRREAPTQQLRVPAWRSPSASRQSG